MSMGILVNAIAGLLFGVGLLISGMADPAKVQNFLDVSAPGIRVSPSSWRARLR